MSEIRVLSPHVADLIAAGEVVERPASVIKEMCENSVDAGAKNITVEIKHGGLTYIRISDDGCGMGPEDAEIAFLRHATSKLRDESGLERIETLGFRGEALAAISSVSHIELRTRRRGSDEGVFMKLTAGEIDDMSPIGCPEGTVMTVRDLFYNTPARLKFLKSDKAEAGACQSAALKTAMANPSVSFRFIKDGEELFFTPGSGDIKETMYALLGRDMAKDMLPGASEGEVSVRGFVCAPTACRGNRAGQFFFVNGRPIKSVTAQNALELAYKNRTMVGRFPSCVLYIQTDCGRVDVNVHPTKAEVRFSDEKAVHSAVYYAALSALDAGKEIPPLGEKPADIGKFSPSAARPTAMPGETDGKNIGMENRSLSGLGSSDASLKAKPRSDFFLTMSAEEYREKFLSGDKKPGAAAGNIAANVSYANDVKPAGQTARLSSGKPVYTVSESKKNEETAKSAEIAEAAEINIPAPKEDEKPKAEELPKAEEEKSLIPTAEEKNNSIENRPLCCGSAFRFVGEAMGTYIIVERDDELVFIDKHAAHERLIFDRLLKSKEPVMSQFLLIPETYTPGAEDMELIEENLESLSFAGFEIDIYGENSVIIRSVPYDCEGSETALLEELCENLRRGGADLRDEMLKTVACKAAIKAGKSSDRSELISLAEKVMKGEVSFCPHGRPVSFAIGKKELDKKIKRIV